MPAIPRRALAIVRILLVSVPFALWLALAGCVGLGVLSSGVAQTFVMGVALALVTVRSGSVWPAIAAHALIDGFGLFVLHGISRAS